jgi:hypothetical protein
MPGKSWSPIIMIVSTKFVMRTIKQNQRVRSDNMNEIAAAAAAGRVETY